jgi:hypothetical protein
VSECILSFEGDVDEIVRRALAADATIVTGPGAAAVGLHRRLRRPRRAPRDGH